MYILCSRAGDAEAYLLSMPDHEATMEEVRHEAGDEHVQEDVRDLQKGILWHSTFNKGEVPGHIMHDLLHMDGKEPMSFWGGNDGCREHL